MEDKYKLKVLIRRVTFLLVVTGCVILYKYALTDYLIVLALLVLFMGIFPISDVDVTFERIKIRSNYFWGLIGISRTIEYDQVESIRSKDCLIETHEEAFLFTDTIAETLAVDLTRPTIKLTTTKLTFKEKNITKNIEIKMTRGEFRDIERRIKYNLPI